MYSARLVRVLPLVAALAACSDVPTGAPPVPPETPEGPRVVGVYEFTITGLGTSDVRASVTPVVAGGPDMTLTPRTSGLSYEVVSSSSVIEGTRGQNGHRYVSVTYRVRNSTGATLNNLTLIPSTSAGTISGTPFTALTLFNGTTADPALASQFVPTGAVNMAGGQGMKVQEIDVLQAFQESEISAVTPPAGVTGLFPYGFVVRSATSNTDRTLPNAATSNEFGGLLTFAFRYPLTASANSDPFNISFNAVAVEDSETRMTESMEEGADSSAVRRIRERAAALGATTVTILPGSPAAASDIPDYPGQRQICSVRTSGTAASPTAYINRPAAYTRINLLRAGESVSACGPYFRAGTASAITPGVAYSLTAVAMDRYGNVRTEVDSVALERVLGPGVTAGPRTALTAGQATISVNYAANGASLLRAVGRRVRDERAIDVGTPTAMLYAGSRQSATAGTPVIIRPSVLVRDAAGNPIANRSVTFSVTGGGGTIAGPTVLTDAAGIAQVGGWTLGATADLNTLTATVQGSVSGSPVAFTAAGCTVPSATGYSISLCFNSSMTASQRTAFASAVTRWQGLVTGDLPNITVNEAAAFCSSTTPSLNMTVDDLLIFAAVENIDGVGGTLGAAGPCWIRNTGSLSIVGHMRFDAADVANLEASGQFGNVILHEMGHVLGIGTLWSYFSLLASPSSVGSPLDTYFNGANGITGFNNIGGSTYTGGNKVPVENGGGSGTINSHWRESVLANELMTGYLNSGGANPLSQLTVRSLSDMGYTVNVAGADPFFLTLSVREGPQEPGIPLNDAWTGPLYRVDAQGRATRIR